MQEYVGEQRVSNSSAVHTVEFSCDLFDASDPGYCFKYISTASSNGAVREEAQHCVSAAESARGSLLISLLLASCAVIIARHCFRTQHITLLKYYLLNDIEIFYCSFLFSRCLLLFYLVRSLFRVPRPSNKYKDFPRVPFSQ